MSMYKSKSTDQNLLLLLSLDLCFSFKARKNINENFLSFFSFKTASLSPENIPRVSDASH